MVTVEGQAFGCKDQVGAGLGTQHNASAVGVRLWGFAAAGAGVKVGEEDLRVWGVDTESRAHILNGLGVVDAVGSFPFP